MTRRTARFLAAVAAVATVVLVAAPAGAETATDQYVVRVREVTVADGLGTIKRAVSDDTFVIDVAGGVDPRQRPGVLWSAADTWYRAARVPNDECWLSCDVDLGGQQNLRTVGAERAWDVTTGSADVVVAVVDTAIALDHPELAGKVRPGIDLRGPACRGDPLVTGHGTGVAGIIGARTDDADGMASLGWSTSVLSIPVLDDCGWATASAVALGIRAAVDARAPIVNLSLAGPAHPAVEEAVAYAHARGVLVVAAAGNDPGGPPEYPGAYPDVLAVGSTDSAGTTLSRFSAKGPWVDLVAPGEDIYSTATALGGHWLWEGTSFAAPHVAAAAALLLAVQPHFDADDLAYSLVRSARDRGDPASPAPLLDAGALLHTSPGALVVLSADGGIQTYGSAAFHGSLVGVRLRAPLVGVTGAPGGGYWMAAADGGVFSFGAPFLGSAASLPLQARIVAIAALPGGRGYWLAGADGGVFTYGAAPFLGSVRAPVVAMAATPSGRGYFLLEASGAVHAFGDARWMGNGSPGAVSISATGADGYYVATAGGGVTARGSAPARRAAPIPPHGRVVSIVAAPSGAGYWLVTDDGRPLAVGGVVDDGRIRPVPVARVVGAAAVS